MSVPYWGAELTEHWDPNWASTLALFFASELSAGITGRQLSVVPGNSVRELYIDSGYLTDDHDWTPESLAARAGELLHPEPKPPGQLLPPLLG
jgi:hypothetical protein